MFRSHGPTCTVLHTSHLEPQLTSPSAPVEITRDALHSGIRLIVPDVTDFPEGIFHTPTPDATTERGLGVTTDQINEAFEALRNAESTSIGEIRWREKTELALVFLNNGFLFERYYEDKEVSTHGENPATYQAGPASHEFTAYMLCYLAQHPEIARSPRWTAIRSRARNQLAGGRRARIFDRPEPTCILEAIANAWHATTLKISCDKTNTDFTALANSFLFHTAYNTDTAIRLGVEPRFLPQNSQRILRANHDSIDAPRRTYDHDLVHHYLLGVASEIPLLEYLAYYHIAEHFFDKIFHDDLIEQIRSGITDPSFSVRRARDIQSLIRIVTRAQRQVRDEGGVNELRALELVLGKFVNFDRLCSDLDSWDASLVDRYKNLEVAFADANKVDLRSTERLKVAKGLAQRIYKVRNSLVHAKEGLLPKFAPFTHDDDLAMEIPLMRFTAEQIVIANGKAI